MSALRPVKIVEDKKL